MAGHGLQDLSTELLLKIFKHLTIPDLCRLRKTCKRFQCVVDTWDHTLLRKHGITLVTNQIDHRFLDNRCLCKLTKIEKLRIQSNWALGRYRESSLLYTRQKYLPWLCMNADTVWLSRGKKIFSYKRNKYSIVCDKPLYTLGGKNKSDFTKFQVKSGHLVSARRDGTIVLWSLEDKQLLVEQKQCHKSEINTVDISHTSDIIVSGSRDNFLKVWSVQKGEHSKLEEYYSKDIQDRVWCVSLSEQNRYVAVGTSGVERSNNSLLIYDIEKFLDHKELQLDKRGSGVLDIRWDCHTLWSCEYDAYVRRWDIRTGKCEQMLEDPFASALYCLDLDYQNTVMAGTQRHGRVVLWDSRMNKCVQFYFMDSCRRSRSSPIYSLAFDSEYLFTATDQCLNVLNFNVFNQPTHDFSHFTKRIIH